MSIIISKQGLFDTIQDKGRYGYQHLGINPGGVMDTVAASVANMLVGNSMDEAVIELHFPASTIIFEKPCVIALSGADFSASVNGQMIPLNTTIIVAASAQLSFMKYKKGAGCYLAVHGAWDARKWLNSYSTNTKVHAGGFNGRTFKNNDVLYFRSQQTLFDTSSIQTLVITTVKVATSLLYSASGTIRCIEGRQYSWLDDFSKKIFNTTSFKITTQSDRMGYRLAGEQLHTKEQKQLLSSAVTRGTIQLLPDGNLILLMADHQATGGYPVIANVISADIPSLAQMQPGASIQFSFISVKEAETIYLQQQQNLLQLSDACKLQLRNFFENDLN
jgi:antagonist of KipI